MAHERYREIAASTLAALSGLLWQYPEGTESLLLAAAMSFHSEPAGGDALAASDDRAASPHLTAELFASHRAVSRGQTFHLAVVFTLDAGWHLYGPRCDPTRVLPTRIAVQPSAALEPAAAVAPPGESSFDPRLQCAMEVYHGRVVFLIPIRVAGGAAIGPADVAVDVSAAACSDRECLPPLRATLATTVTIQAETQAAPPRHRELFESLGVPGEATPSTLRGR